MMKKSELIFAAVLVPLDFLMLIAAALAAYFLRFTALTDIRPVILEWPFHEYINVSLLVALVWLIIFALSGLYTMGGTRRLVDELIRVFLVCSTSIMAVIVFVFFKRELLTSRFIVLAVWGLSVITVCLGRIIMRGIRNILFRNGIGVHRVVVIGSEKTTDNIVAEMHRRPGMGYKVVGKFADFSDTTKEQMEELASRHGIDEIILSNPALSREKTLELLDFINEKHWVFKYTADMLEAQSTNLEVNTIAGVPIVEIKKTPLDGWGKIVKRVFDVIFSIIFIIILSPVILLTILMIKLDSRGPIFFSRLDDGSPLKRVGEKGKLFRYFKFRSMKPGVDSLRYTKLAEENFRKDSPMVKIKNDPRVTRVGRLIRRFSIDELAELFLVLRGKMSLVGPRPHLPEEVDRYQKHHKRVLDIKPGMTGLAQISGRSDLDFEEEVKLDTYYIENWSLKLDLQILFKTPWAVIARKAND
ncbi:MAG: sugar transferase [bacterium]